MKLFLTLQHEFIDASQISILPDLLPKQNTCLVFSCSPVLAALMSTVLAASNTAECNVFQNLQVIFSREKCITEKWTLYKNLKKFPCNACFPFTDICRGH